MSEVSAALSQCRVAAEQWAHAERAGSIISQPSPLGRGCPSGDGRVRGNLIQAPIKKIVMQKYKTESVSVSLDAYIDDDGSLNMEGQDIGDSVEKYWGDSDYEHFLYVKKEDKEKIPLLLLKERFASMTDFLKWLDEKGLPAAPGDTAPDFETHLNTHLDYQDTILLFLLKEQFTTMSDFMAWLNERKIAKEFGSWA